MLLAHLEDVPLDDGPPGVLQSLLPMLEARLVLLVLAPAKLDLTDRISATDQIVIADLKCHSRLINIYRACDNDDIKISHKI